MMMMRVYQYNLQNIYNSKLKQTTKKKSVSPDEKKIGPHLFANISTKENEGYFPLNWVVS